MTAFGAGRICIGEHEGQATDGLAREMLVIAVTARWILGLATGKCQRERQQVVFLAERVNVWGMSAVIGLELGQRN